MHVHHIPGAWCPVFSTISVRDSRFAATLESCCHVTGPSFIFASGHYLGRYYVFLLPTSWLDSAGPRPRPTLPPPRHASSHRSVLPFICAEFLLPVVACFGLLCALGAFAYPAYPECHFTGFLLSVHEAARHLRSEHVSDDAAEHACTRFPPSSVTSRHGLLFVVNCRF